METKKSDRAPQSADKYVVRFPDGMRDRIAEIAKANGRSMNAEIVQRLEWALSMTSAPEHKPNQPDLSGDLPFAMRLDINDLAQKAGVSFHEMVARIFIAGIHPDAPQILYLPIVPGATMQDLRTAMAAAHDFVRPDATLVSEKVAYNVQGIPATGIPSTDAPKGTPAPGAPLATKRTSKKTP